MPWDRSKYPPEWDQFSARIRFGRAAGRCECEGECGLHRTHPGPRRCTETNGAPATWARGKIMLTVAHLCDCAPPCAIDDHVKACCQRCHLRIDVPLHVRNASSTRRRRLEEAGQQTLDMRGF